MDDTLVITICINQNVIHKSGKYERKRERKMQEGRFTRFNEDRGFGFITYYGGSIFFHRNQWRLKTGNGWELPEDHSWHTPLPGERAVFDIKEDGQGRLVASPWGFAADRRN